MPTSSKPKRLADAYRVSGFRPLGTLRGVFGDRKARVITLARRSKKRHAPCADGALRMYDRSRRRARDLSNGDTRIYLEFEVRRLDCRSCGQVKRERLSFLADNTHYTERFAYYVGRRCRNTTVQDVAQELHLDWHAVKELEKQYMRAQLARAGTPGPGAIGVDEISIANATPTASWSATLFGLARSGSGAKIARKRAWPNSTNGWEIRRVGRSAWR